MYSTERPVPMPRVSTTTTTTTTTSTTTTTCSTTWTTTSTFSSSRSPLTSPSLLISNQQSQALPTTLVPARQIISTEIGFFSKSQGESGVANDLDIERLKKPHKPNKPHMCGIYHSRSRT